MCEKKERNEILKKVLQRVQTLQDEQAIQVKQNTHEDKVKVKVTKDGIKIEVTLKEEKRSIGDMVVGAVVTELLVLTLGVHDVWNSYNLG